MLALFSAFILGIAGSLHCMGMCGPLVMSLPFEGSKNKLTATLFYNIGKATTYSLLGLFAGMLGKGFVLIKWQQSLSIFSGIFLLIIAFFPYFKNKLSSGNFIPALFQKLQQATISKNSNTYFLFFGIINGLLPCGLVYTALAGAMVTGNALQGMLFMLLFGIGTMPSLSAIILFKQKLKFSKSAFFTKSTFYISVLVGVLLIVRGMNLGIPYISPSFNSETKEMSCCHKK